MLNIHSPNSSPSEPSAVGVPNCRRILAIDDNPEIHADYRKVLHQRKKNEGLAAAESLLFGDDSELAEDTYDTCEIDSAFQGKDGFELVRESLKKKTPYAVAFIDVRMPPGWDGIETIKRIWEIAPDLPIVLCTAYSDYSWEKISQELMRPDQLLFLKKPFDPAELRQIAAGPHFGRTCGGSQKELLAADNKTQMTDQAIADKSKTLGERLTDGDSSHSRPSEGHQ